MEIRIALHRGEEMALTKGLECITRVDGGFATISLFPSDAVLYIPGIPTLKGYGLNSELNRCASIGNTFPSIMVWNCAIPYLAHR